MEYGRKFWERKQCWSCSFFSTPFSLPLSLSLPPFFPIIIHFLPHQLLSKVVHFKDNPSNPQFWVPFPRESPELPSFLTLSLSRAFRRPVVTGTAQFSELLCSWALAFFFCQLSLLRPLLGRIPLSLSSPKSTVVLIHQQCLVASFLFHDKVLIFLSYILCFPAGFCSVRDRIIYFISSLYWSFESWVVGVTVFLVVYRHKLFRPFCYWLICILKGRLNQNVWSLLLWSQDLCLDDHRMSFL